MIVNKNFIISRNVKAEVSVDPAELFFLKFVIVLLYNYACFISVYECAKVLEIRFRQIANIWY